MLTGGGTLWHYEKRLLKLYCFWIIVLSPAILFCWHKEYLDFSLTTPYLFIRNFFFAYQFGASWFFGALIVGVPIVYGLNKILSDRWVWIIPFIVYVYVWIKVDDKAIFDWYETNIRTPELSFPAGLMWITMGHLLSGNVLSKAMERTPIWCSALACVISFALGCVFNDYDYLFLIVTVLSIIFMSYHIKIDNLALCKRLRTYSIHFFCIHYSLLWLLGHIHILSDNRFIRYFAAIVICWLASEVIMFLQQRKYFHWLRWSA